MKINVAGKSFEAGRVFCIGRNYAAHAKELKNDIPDEPVIFCKPPTSLVSHLQHEISFPSFGRVLHHEVEIVVLIGKAGKPESENDALNYIAGLTAGLDLTMRDVFRTICGNRDCHGKSPRRLIAALRSENFCHLLLTGNWTIYVFPVR